MSDAPVGPGWRADVRDTVVRILADRVRAVNGRVHRARVWPVTSKPALLVYGYAEKKELINAGGWQHQFRVTANMVVRVLAEGAIAERAEDDCESLAGQVERAILQAPDLFSPSLPPDRGIWRCAAVDTQISAEQKERAVEVEATMQFQLVWEETFTMAEPVTAECADVEVGTHDLSIPTA